MGMNQIASDLYKALTESDERKPKAGDVKATVIREEGNTVWVKFPGGEDETPVEKTNNATMGDEVLVRVADGRAWILGNNTSPATDDTEAKKAANKAVEAFDTAAFAAAAAETAQTAANSAIRSAEVAEESAQAAQSSADQAAISASNAERQAEIAYSNADAAQNSANESLQAANMAMSQLGIVENVVGVLDLVAEHGVYEETQDTEPLADKWYFTRSGTSPDYIYTIVNSILPSYLKTKDIAIDETKTYYEYVNDEYVVVEEPVLADIDDYYEYSDSPYLYGYYEIVNIDDAIKNYVSSHLVLTEEGLWLQHGTSPTKVLLSPSRGLVITNQNSQQIAQYGEQAVIGIPTGFNIKIGGTNNEIGFYQGELNKVAYINQEQLYVANALSFGNFIFYQRDNGHFTLKWFNPNAQ